MSKALPYSDDDLTAAIATSRSWRGVLRSLGKSDTSAGSFRAARRRADQLGLSYSHFTGQRRWSDAQLVSAISAARSWHDVTRALAISASGYPTVRAHAVRLGCDTRHLDDRRPKASGIARVGEYDDHHLRSAGSMFAACWFTLRGSHVSWPLEPCRYDLAVDFDGGLQRVQVKTTTGVGPGANVTVSNSRRRGFAVYGPDEIDHFFVIDGELSAYLIPYATVAGYTQLTLGRYVHFKVVERGALLSEIASP